MILSCCGPRFDSCTEFLHYFSEFSSNSRQFSHAFSSNINFARNFRCFPTTINTFRTFWRLQKLTLSANTIEPIGTIRGSFDRIIRNFWNFRQKSTEPRRRARATLLAQPVGSKIWGRRSRNAVGPPANCELRPRTGRWSAKIVPADD